MDKNKTLTEAANDLIEHAMGQGIPGRMIPFVEALRVAKNERKAESDAARQEIASLRAQLATQALPPEEDIYGGVYEVMLSPVFQPAAQALDANEAIVDASISTAGAAT